jgi:hypothetical protein
VSGPARPPRPTALAAAALIEALTQEHCQQDEALLRAEQDCLRSRDEAARQRTRAEVAESALETARQQLRRLEERQTATSPMSIGTAPSLPPEYERLLHDLEAFRMKIHRPHFWTAAFAETFAESLATMDRAHRPLEVTDPRELPTVFRAWHQELEAAVEQFVTDRFDPDLAEQLRRTLICQWVYLRWLELTDHLERT